MLTIELVPEQLFFSNLRNAVGTTDWDILRRDAYAKAGHRCEICSGKGVKWPVECHEVWQYDDKVQLQKLLGLQALCPDCHGVKHFGRTQLMGREEEALAHLMKVNSWSEHEARAYVWEAFSKWAERSAHHFQWRQDLTWATGKVKTWKSREAREMAIEAGWKEVEKDKRARKVAHEMMED